MFPEAIRRKDIKSNSQRTDIDTLDSPWKVTAGIFGFASSDL